MFLAGSPTPDRPWLSTFSACCCRTTSGSSARSVIPQDIPCVEYFNFLTFMIRAFIHHVAVHVTVCWLKDETSKRSYGFWNFVILCGLLFCVVMLMLLATFMHPFMLRPTEEVQYHMWCYPTHHLDLVRLLFSMSIGYFFYFMQFTACLAFLLDRHVPALIAFFEFMA